MLARLAAVRSLSPAHSPFFIAALGVLMSFGPMGTDMYLPGMPAIGADLRASQGQVQWTLSAFFLGFGVGQLLWGALGDRFGRRGPVATGILLYAVGCVGCSLTGDIAHLALWRFVQALGACAGPVLVRAMIRDVFERDRAASTLSMMMLVMGAAPIIAPLIGGQILVWADWRWIFWAQAIFGAVAMLALFTLPETLAAGNRTSLRPMLLAQSYRRLLTDRAYLGYAVGSSFIYAGMFAFISGSPFVYIELFGVRPENYGYLFGINIVGMILVNTVNSRIVMRFGSDRILRAGTALSAASGLLLAVVALEGWGGLWGLVGCLFLFMALTGLTNANAMAGAMQSFPQMAGTASALAGMLQFSTGALAGWVVGLTADGTAMPMALVIGGSAVVSLALNRSLVRRGAGSAAL
ncbi:DHA1 family bicyclomycin/chloramphenicol resistance-like MFS transporter [Azospirillum agricola]|uniref:Bcr/CflA family multidrug efflux MFS transporter n=1 Tax=Azospirillum agricola TaxID=1720247 RepID=UPI001AE239D3|nr:Bcr/CflA family multidrug efflux MFS transporter [Azospirillum agricola]MBP2232014.1 DHA1 family bicyclomycin/chloramphenicol resistance-like MFS transporter [Azospirillum agricola]